jgi:hypothetical protein
VVGWVGGWPGGRVDLLHDTNGRSSIAYILQSLTPSHRSILALLAKFQLQQPKEALAGMTFETWFSACQDDMLVLNEVAFRAHLQELLDHDLIV